MHIDNYINIREQYKELTCEIFEFDKSNSTGIKRAGKKFGFLQGNTLYYDGDEDELNVIMDYMLYEKNGKTNRLIDRYFADCAANLNETKRIILEGMLKNVYSVYEILECSPHNQRSRLFDLLEKKEYELMDVAMSQTANKGMLISTRLIPIENTHMTSGLIFAFQPDKRLRLLTEISKNRHRKRKITIKPKKKNSVSLIEIMFNANKKWGMDVVML